MGAFPPVSMWCPPYLAKMCCEGLVAAGFKVRIIPKEEIYDPKTVEYIKREIGVNVLEKEGFAADVGGSPWSVLELKKGKPARSIQIGGFQCLEETHM